MYLKSILALFLSDSMTYYKNLYFTNYVTAEVSNNTSTSELIAISKL